MGLISRNFAIVMALLVALQAAHAAPANKDGEGKGGKGKGRRSVGEEGVVAEEGVSALEGSLADALAEDAETALMLEDEVRVRRAVAAEDEPPVGAAYVEGEASAAGAELQAQGDDQSQLMRKKPCRGRKDDGNTDTESTGEAGDMQRQRQKGGKNKKQKRPMTTTEASALVGLLPMIDEARW